MTQRPHSFQSVEETDEARKAYAAAAKVQAKERGQ